MELSEASVVDISGGLLPSDEHATFEGVEPVAPEAIDVLSKWDAYMMGYAPDGRQCLADDEHLGSAYSTASSASGATAGDGRPLVPRGGRTVASLSHRFEGNRMPIKARSGAMPFRALRPRLR